MAQYGKLQFVIRDSNGNPIQGASIEVRKQGAQIRGGAGASPYPVDDIGSVSTGATVQIYTTSTKAFGSSGTATIAGANSISVSPTIGNSVDDDRMTITSPLPTIYEDITANTSTTNPLSTDTTGYAECYVEGGFYDAKVSGASITTFLKTDIFADGGRTTAYVFDVGTAVGFRDNLVNAATGSTLASAGAVIREFCHAGTRKASIDKDGDLDATDIRSATITTTGAASIGGNETVSGTLSVTGATTAAAITASGLITGSAGLTISAGTVSLPAGEIGTTELAANSITSVNSAIQGALMGLTTTPTTITNCSIGPINITSTSSNIFILGICSTTGGGATARTVTLGLYEDGVLLTNAANTGVVYDSAGITSNPPISTFTIRTGVSGNHTYTLKASQNAGSDVSVPANTGRLLVIEIKK